MDGVPPSAYFAYSAVWVTALPRLCVNSRSRLSDFSSLRMHWKRPATIDRLSGLHLLLPGRSGCQGTGASMVGARDQTHHKSSIARDGAEVGRDQGRRPRPNNGHWPRSRHCPSEDPAGRAFSGIFIVRHIFRQHRLHGLFHRFRMHAVEPAFESRNWSCTFSRGSGWLVSRLIRGWAVSVQLAVKCFSSSNSFSPGLRPTNLISMSRSGSKPERRIICGQGRRS